MVTNRVITLLIAGLLVSATGCSGGRLRNMVGRSDYSSIEELESRDGSASTADYAEVRRKGNATTDGQFVSQQRKLAEEQPIEVEKRRKGFMDFAKVFNRKSDEDEFAPDPFSEPVTATTEQKRTSDPVVVRRGIEPLDTKAAPTKIENFSSTIADVEKQSADLFADASKSIKPSMFETEPLTADVDTEPAANEGQDQSFADFMNEQKRLLLIQSRKSKRRW